jgi:hypothetical protein
MWICFNDAFVSAVQHETKPNLLKVRARKRKHLERLFPGYKVHRSEDTDYRFRVFVTKKLFAFIVAKRVREIDYPNFKDSVRDDELHDLYAGFWFQHRKYQER